MRAIIIGINEYRHIKPLKGAAADARDIAATLRASGAADLKLLLDEEVDRATILREFESLLWPIARAAGDLLVSDQLPYVRTCVSKTCEWFFLDTSKSHHRRWCDMTRCGNRAKVQRFYARQKKTSS